MNRRSLALVLMLALPAVAAAVDVPVAGKRLDLNASRDQARARVVVADPALAAPLPDPAIGAALIVNAGAAAGQCRAEILLTRASGRRSAATAHARAGATAPRRPAPRACGASSCARAC